MNFLNSTFIRSVFIFLCIDCVHNKRRIFRLNGISDFYFDSASDINLNSRQLIEKYGYPVETHSVTAADGYIINLFRIPNSGPPVLLAHGIGDSSDCWLVLGPANSLAYLLANAGYDVWLYNARDNKYSKRHTRNLSRELYWNFSYEEMGSQDLPAAIDYILQTTSRAKLSYVGFSQGTTIFFVMCSMRPEYNVKINHAVLLAPVAWTANLKFPFIDIITPNLEQLTKVVKKLGFYEWFSNNEALNLYHSKVCDDSTAWKILCELEYYVSYGVKNISYFPPEKLPVIASHIPAGTSAKTFIHYMQGYSTKRFQRYHYYEVGKNEMLYGSSQPPLYNLSLVSAPVTLISSKVDWYSTFEDVQRLKNSLPNIVNFVMFDKTEDFTHLEFVYGTRVKTLVNDPVVSLL